MLEIEPEAPTAAFDAVLAYLRTGAVQTFPDFGALPAVAFYLYAHTGQLDRANDEFEGRLRQGGYASVSSFHADHRSDALRADPRYQALLLQARIAW